MVSQSSLDLELKLLHFIYAGSCLLQNVQQLFSILFNLSISQEYSKSGRNKEVNFER